MAYALAVRKNKNYIVRCVPEKCVSACVGELNQSINWLTEWIDWYNPS